MQNYEVDKKIIFNIFDLSILFNVMEKYLTKEKLEEFKKELNMLKNVERPKIIEKIKTAIGFGDLSENAEYQDAKEAQGFLEGKIIKLEGIIKDAKIVTKNNNVDYAQIGKFIILENMSNKKREEFKIVGIGESDPENGKISYESPLGSLLLKRKKGDFVKIVNSKNKIKYKIVEIR